MFVDLRSRMLLHILPLRHLPLRRQAIAHLRPPLDMAVG